MTAADIVRRVDDLIALSNRDNETAAAGSAELRFEVLQAIADGARDSVALA